MLMAVELLQLTKEDLKQVILEMFPGAVLSQTKPEKVEATKTEKAPRLYTREEVCSILGVSKPTFHRLANIGAFSLVKIGRHTRVDADDLDRKIAAGQVGRYHRGTYGTK